MSPTVNVVVPTMPVRAACLAALQAQLAALPWCAPARVAVSLHTDGRQDVARAVAAGLALPAADWLLYLEDDAYLGPAVAALPMILASTPLAAAAATFFSLRAYPAGWTVLPGRALSMTQLVAFRPAVLDGFAAFPPRWYAAHSQHVHAPDLLLAAWLGAQRARLAVYSPSLVQHRPVPSTFKGRSRGRLSPTYTATYGAVPDELAS